MSRARRWAISLGIVAIAVCMIAFGATRGEVPVILSQAVTVCLECMGIG
ncbi:MAG: CD1871A family CXXC motif-containing protein [Coriobacteriales bacterium]